MGQMGTNGGQMGKPFVPTIGRTNGVWVYKTHPFVLLSQSIWDDFVRNM